jgi:CDGSH-type Zn-finger protein
MSKLARAADTPFDVDVEKGRQYFWCSCSKSENQPFCDGFHKGSEFSPVRFTPTESKKYFCMAVNSRHHNPCATVVINKYDDQLNS